MGRGPKASEAGYLGAGQGIIKREWAKESSRRRLARVGTLARAKESSRRWRSDSRHVDTSAAGSTSPYLVQVEVNGQSCGQTCGQSNTTWVVPKVDVMVKVVVKAVAMVQGADHGPVWLCGRDQEGEREWERERRGGGSE